MEASNLPDTEFKKMVIRMVKETIEDCNSIRKDMESIQNHKEVNNTISEMKNILEGPG